MVPRQAKPDFITPLPIPETHLKGQDSSVVPTVEENMPNPELGDDAVAIEPEDISSTIPESANGDKENEKASEKNVKDGDPKEKSDKLDGQDTYGYEWVVKFMNKEFVERDFTDRYGYDEPQHLVRRWAHSEAAASVAIIAYIRNLENKVKQLEVEVTKGKEGKDGDGEDDNDEDNGNSSDAGSATGSDADSVLSGSETSRAGSKLKSSKKGVKWSLSVTRTRQIDDRYKIESEEEDFGDDDLRNKNMIRGGDVLKIRRRFFRNGLHKGTRMHFRSPYLRKAIREVAKLPQFTKASRDQDSFLDYPYWELFHYRKQFTEYAEKLEGEDKLHVEFMLKFMRDEFPEASKFKDEIEATTIKTIDPQYTWLLYEPGTLVFNKLDEQWQAYKVKSLSGMSKRDDGSLQPLTLKLVSFEFSDKGTMLRERRIKETVKTEGVQELKIGEMDYIPAALHPRMSGILSILRSRGQQYWSYNDKPHFREYVGDYWPKNEHTDVLRVVVDTRRLDMGSGGPAGPRYSPEDSDSDSDSIGSGYRTRRRERLQEEIEEMEAAAAAEARTVKVEPTEEQYILCPATIQAFSLRRKSWGYVNLTDLRPVVFQTEAFDKLVIKKDYKSLVTSMISAYIGNKVLFKDLVKGKGQGLVILLHGAPGIGKTLTAECIAETQGRPLYMLTSGDLGVDATSLETKLREAFELATRWNAVLLLDEADVFLQERDVRQLERNALVSVFLREVEYFDGILFLTTNRPGWLDEAFQSRIHLTLHLPKLEPVDQLRVWSIFLYNTRNVRSLSEKQQEFLTKVMESTLTDAAVSKDGKDGHQKQRGGLNGREIRNHVMTARALAVERNPGKSVDGVEIGFEDISKVLKAAREFSDYMKTVQRVGPEERAMQNHWRRD